MVTEVYPKGLCDYIADRGYIPRLINKGEELSMYHVYWLVFENRPMKVLDVYEIEGYKYYYTKCNSNDSYHQLSHPLDWEAYELLKIDFDTFEDSNIIGNKHLGFLIKYWIHLNYHNPDYEAVVEAFKNQRCSLNDNSRYLVKCKFKDEKIENCVFIRVNKEDLPYDGKRKLREKREKGNRGSRKPRS